MTLKKPLMITFADEVRFSNLDSPLSLIPTNKPTRRVDRLADEITLNKQHQQGARLETLVDRLDR